MEINRKHYKVMRRFKLEIGPGTAERAVEWLGAGPIRFKMCLLESSKRNAIREECKFIRKSESSSVWHYGLHINVHDFLTYHLI